MQLEFRHTRHEYPEPEAPSCRPKIKKKKKNTEQQKKNMELDQTGDGIIQSDSVFPKQILIQFDHMSLTCTLVVPVQLHLNF